MRSKLSISHKTHLRGFSLIELVIFIVVTGIALSAVLLTFTVVLQAAPIANYQSVCNQLAEGRMEFILGQKRINGFSTYTDPCSSGSPPAICTLPAALSAYTLSTSITSTTVSGDSNYNIIAVTASGPLNSKAQAQTLVGGY